MNILGEKVIEIIKKYNDLKELESHFVNYTCEYLDLNNETNFKIKTLISNALKHEVKMYSVNELKVKQVEANQKEISLVEYLEAEENEFIDAQIKNNINSFICDLKKYNLLIKEGFNAEYYLALYISASLKQYK